LKQCCEGTRRLAIASGGTTATRASTRRQAAPSEPNNAQSGNGKHHHRNANRAETRRTTRARQADSRRPRSRFPDRGPEETKPTRSAARWWRSRRWRVERPAGHGWRAHVGAVRGPTGTRLCQRAPCGGDLRTTDSRDSPTYGLSVPFRAGARALPLLSVFDGLSLSTGIVSAPGLWRSGRFSTPA
jgi:hypothetical protein